jgi:hypothetical protein
LAFTTWTALKTQMENDLAAGQSLTASYAVDNSTRTFRSFPEWQAFYGYVCAKAAQESIGSAPLGRTYARPGRRL